MGPENRGDSEGNRKIRKLTDKLFDSKTSEIVNPKYVKKTAEILPAFIDPSSKEKGKNPNSYTIAGIQPKGEVTIHEVSDYPTGPQGTKKRLEREKTKERRSMQKLAALIPLEGADAARNLLDWAQTDSTGPKLGLVVDAAAFLLTLRGMYRSIERTQQINTKISAVDQVVALDPRNEERKHADKPKIPEPRLPVQKNIEPPNRKHQGGHHKDR